MNSFFFPILAQVAVDLPQQMKDNLSYGLLIIIAVAAVFCVIKCIQGADMLDQGEDGKKKIYAGIAIGFAPWLAVAAFRATNLWDKLGLSLVPSGVSRLPDELVGTITLATWAVIGIAAIWCVIKCIAGASELERGEDGKKKIFSGLAIAAAPWIAIFALNQSGFWTALGLQLI